MNKERNESTINAKKNTQQEQKPKNPTTTQPMPAPTASTTTTTGASCTESQQNRRDEKATSVVRVKHEASIAPFNPTCDQAIETALTLFHFRHQTTATQDDADDDVLFDLGCGDARMLLYSAERAPFLKCVGIDLDPIFVNRGREALKKLPESVQCRVDIREGDLLQIMNDYSKGGAKHQDNDENAVDTASATATEEKEEDINRSDDVMGKECQKLSLFEDATAIFIFLLPKGIQKIQGLLNALAEKRVREGRSLQVVAYMFSVREWEPVLVDRSTKGEAPLYLYKFGPGVNIEK